MEKLKRQLADAEAALEARKKPTATETGPQVVAEGLVINEWVSKDPRNCCTHFLLTLKFFNFGSSHS